MKKAPFALLLFSLLIEATAVLASGPIGVYTIVEKVIMEPNEKNPERVQIWGAFSLFNRNDSSYSDAQRGYLYYRIDSSICSRSQVPTCTASIENQTRAIWSDLKKVAGTGQAVGFGGGFLNNADAKTPLAKIRKATEKPGSPDPFTLGNSVVTLGSSQNDIIKKLKAALQSE